jgi:hypothetical protein
MVHFQKAGPSFGNVNIIAYPDVGHKRKGIDFGENGLEYAIWAMDLI